MCGVCVCEECVRVWWACVCACVRMFVWMCVYALDVGVWVCVWVVRCSYSHNRIHHADENGMSGASGGKATPCVLLYSS